MKSTFTNTLKDAQLQASFKESLKILLIGELCSDVYYFGNCTRISPEAPIPVLSLLPKATIIRAGMSGNVANQLKALGSAPENHIHNHEEIIKSRFVDSKHLTQMLRVDTDPVIEPLSKAIIENISFDYYDVVVVSDYNKGLITHDIASYITYQCKRNNVLSFIDTKKNDLSPYDGASFIKINDDEAKKLVSKQLRWSALITTHGDAGASICYPDNKGFTVPTVSRQVRDVTGAGDVFLASFAISYTNTRNIQTSIEFANQLAGLSVEQFGTVSISID